MSRLSHSWGIFRPSRATTFAVALMRRISNVLLWFAEHCHRLCDRTLFGASGFSDPSLNERHLRPPTMQTPSRTSLGMSQLFVYLAGCRLRRACLRLPRSPDGLERGSCCRPPLNRQDSSYPCRCRKPTASNFFVLSVTTRTDMAALSQDRPSCWFSCATSVAHLPRSRMRIEKLRPRIDRLERSLRLFTYRPRNARKNSLTRIILAISAVCGPRWPPLRGIRLVHASGASI